MEYISVIKPGARSLRDITDLGALSRIYGTPLSDPENLSIVLQPADKNFVSIDALFFNRHNGAVFT